MSREIATYTKTEKKVNRQNIHPLPIVAAYSRRIRIEKKKTENTTYRVASEVNILTKREPPS